MESQHFINQQSKIKLFFILVFGSQNSTRRSIATSENCLRVYFRGNTSEVRSRSILPREKQLIHLNEKRSRKFRQEKRLAKPVTNTFFAVFC